MQTTVCPGKFGLKIFRYGKFKELKNTHVLYNYLTRYILFCKTILQNNKLRDLSVEKKLFFQIP